MQGRSPCLEAVGTVNTVKPRHTKHGPNALNVLHFFFFTQITCLQTIYKMFTNVYKTHVYKTTSVHTCSHTMRRRGIMRTPRLQGTLVLSLMSTPTTRLYRTYQTTAESRDSGTSTPNLQAVKLDRKTKHCSEELNDTPRPEVLILGRSPRLSGGM